MLNCQAGQKEKSAGNGMAFARQLDPGDTSSYFCSCQYDCWNIVNVCDKALPAQKRHFHAVLQGASFPVARRRH